MDGWQRHWATHRTESPVPSAECAEPISSREKNLVSAVTKRRRVPIRRSVVADSSVCKSLGQVGKQIWPLQRDLTMNLDGLHGFFQTINIASGVPSLAHQDSIGASDLPTVTRQRYYAIVDILQVFKLQIAENCSRYSKEPNKVLACHGDHDTSIASARAGYKSTTVHASQLTVSPQARLNVKQNHTNPLPCADLTWGFSLQHVVAPSATSQSGKMTNTTYKSKASKVKNR